jgi:hypothetical protein
MIFDIKGRKIKIATGKKTQSINICDDENILGKYEQVYRIVETGKFLGQKDVNFIKNLGSIDAFSNFLLKKGALKEEFRSGKKQDSDSKVPQQTKQGSKRQSSSLTTILKKNKGKISQYLYVGRAKWDELLKRIENQEINPKRDFDDEQIWTFLVACGYAFAGKRGVDKINKILTNVEQRFQPHLKIWYEALPMPPRIREGNTNLDLALGNIELRDSVESGIELEEIEKPWICFCEMKWYSDISVRVTHDPHRNQLLRVIENALCFQNYGQFAERVYITLVTPKIFKETNLKSRLYKYKYEEYQNNPDAIMSDIESSHLKNRSQQNWIYPEDINTRIAKLSLNWVTYETLFEKMPETMISEEVHNFFSNFNRTNFHIQ